jgi:hypothetical protein
LNVKKYIDIINDIVIDVFIKRRKFMDRNQKLQMYKYFLDSGKIDEDRYKDEVDKLKNSKIRNATLETKLMILIIIVFVTAMAWNIHKNSRLVYTIKLYYIIL